MADSDDEVVDFSNVLLETLHDTEYPFSFDDAPTTKRRKGASDKNGSVEDLDLFSNDAPTKSKLSGSSFKNMGRCLRLLV